MKRRIVVHSVCDTMQTLNKAAADYPETSAVNSFLDIVLHTEEMQWTVITMETSCHIASISIVLYGYELWSLALREEH